MKTTVVCLAALLAAASACAVEPNVKNWSDATGRQWQQTRAQFGLAAGVTEQNYGRLLHHYYSDNAEPTMGYCYYLIATFSSHDLRAKALLAKLDPKKPWYDGGNLDAVLNLKWEEIPDCIRNPNAEPTGADRFTPLFQPIEGDHAAFPSRKSAQPMGRVYDPGPMVAPAVPMKIQMLAVDPEGFRDYMADEQARFEREHPKAAQRLKQAKVNPWIFTRPAGIEHEFLTGAKAGPERWVKVLLTWGGSVIYVNQDGSPFDLPRTHWSFKGQAGFVLATMCTFEDKATERLLAPEKKK